jgi:ketosteroid isomerase-like protein
VKPLPTLSPPRRVPRATALKPSSPKPTPYARRRARYVRAMTFAFGMLAVTGAGSLKAASADAAQTVAALDTAFQFAVKHNDAATIERMLDPEMVLVTGRGKVFTAAQHVTQAKAQTNRYEQQNEVAGTQQVRVHGDTAIVTALLWIKGTDESGKAFDYKVWFSDTYVRKPAGWKYVFGQSSPPLPKEAS